MSAARPLSVLGRLADVQAALTELAEQLDRKSREDVRAELEAINLKVVGVRRAITGEPQA